MIRIWGEEWDVQRTFIVLRNGSPVGHVADVEAGSDGVGRHLILCAQKTLFAASLSALGWFYRFIC